MENEEEETSHDVTEQEPQAISQQSVPEEAILPVPAHDSNETDLSTHALQNIPAPVNSTSTIQRDNDLSVTNLPNSQSEIDARIRENTINAPESAIDMPPIPEETSENYSGISEESDDRDTAILTDSLQNLRLDRPSQITVRPNVDRVVEMIKSGECKNIITMVGAGISTAAGIPDFRSVETGIYHKIKIQDLPYPEAMFELKYFMMNPKPFFQLVKELMPGTYRPTKTHYFIKLLQDKNLLLRHYTQNIDNLERVVGLLENRLVEAHGTFYRSHCLRCGKEYSFEWITEKIYADEIPTCSCEGVVKPDIVFFGEPLPRYFFEKSSRDFRMCDLLIIMGSSLQVEPFASLCDRVNRDCIRLLINKDVVGKKAGLMFDTPENTRDIAWIENCDTACEILVDKLEWTEEWLQLIH